MPIAEINLSYSETNPALYFVQIEAYCEFRSITSKTKKFTSVVSAVPYKLKEEPIARTSSSYRKKLLQLLNKERIGGGEPSQFVRRLQCLAGN